MNLLREKKRTATILNGQTTSDAIPLRGLTITGFRVPAAFTGVTITFTASEDVAGTYAPVYDSDGNQVSCAIAVSRWIGLSGTEADALASCPFVKLVSGSAEGADRSIAVALK